MALYLQWTQSFHFTVIQQKNRPPAGHFIWPVESYGSQDKIDKDTISIRDIVFLSSPCKRVEITTRLSGKHFCKEFYSTIHKDGIRTFSKILPMKMLVLNVFPLQRQLVKPNLMITLTCICQSPLARYSTHTVLYYKHYYILMRKILTATIVPSSIAKCDLLEKHAR